MVAFPPECPLVYVEFVSLHLYLTSSCSSAVLEAVCSGDVHSTLPRLLNYMDKYLVRVIHPKDFDSSVFIITCWRWIASL